MCWYQKPTDTGTILNFRGCAPLQCKKKTLLKGRFIGFSEVPQHGSILTRHWKKNRKLWIENQYPKNWSDRVVFETLNKIIEGKKNLEVKASEPRNDKWIDHQKLG